MEDSYRVFGPCLLFKGVYSDDLGHVFRAGFIADNAVDRMVWLRLFDDPDLPAAAVSGALERAREVSEHLSGSQLPAHPFFVESDGVPALGGDYTPGQPLNKVLTTARDEAFPLQPDNCLLIVEKIALALVAAEAVVVDGEPLAHGFLHPGLIHVSHDGEATVMGFGLGGALVSGLQSPSTTPGARAYLAPEVLSDGVVSARCDVYSLGAILFHLLTGTALPSAPADREAALKAARLAWDGEVLPNDIAPLLDRALAPSPAARFASAEEFRGELDGLLYGGAYSPTTFNLALFMDRLFRPEIDADEVAMAAEETLDPTPFLVVEPPPAELGEDSSAAEPAALIEPEAVPPTAEGGNKKILPAVFGGVAAVAAVAAVLWFTVGRGPQAPPPEPTPTDAEIAAERQAQDERLRSLTQELVQQMMADREEEIRQELIARQSRIEELQRRLQQSEKRAATSASAAADEAATQKALMEEIEKQEEAQRAQEDALEAERKQAELNAAGQVAAAGSTDPGTAEGSPDPAATDKTSAAQVSQDPLPTAVPTAEPSPAPTTAKPVPEPSAAPVAFGDFVPPELVDTRPVVVKSQPLEWPRNAARSKGKGLVIVELTVNAEGGVEDVTVLRADHTGWGIPEAALDAAMGYRFKPGTKDGIAITTKAFVTWRYDFTGG